MPRVYVRGQTVLAVVFNDYRPDFSALRVVVLGDLQNLSGDARVDRRAETVFDRSDYLTTVYDVAGLHCRLGGDSDVLGERY